MSFYNTVIDKLNIKNKTYKVGILNYSSKDLWKKVFKSLKVKGEV